MSENAPWTEDERAERRLSMAGALIGVAAGGFLVTVLGHMGSISDWYMGRYQPAAEPAAALLGALGVWCCTPRRGLRTGLLGMAAALLAMLLGDVFRVLAASAPEWRAVPRELLRSFRWHHWPRLLCYGFGIYLGWYLGSAGHRDAAEDPD